jgi:hypothetical protein
MFRVYVEPSGSRLQGDLSIEMEPLAGRKSAETVHSRISFPALLPPSQKSTAVKIDLCASHRFGRIVSDRYQNPREIELQQLYTKLSDRKKFTDSATTASTDRLDRQARTVAQQLRALSESKPDRLTRKPPSVQTDLSLLKPPKAQEPSKGGSVGHLNFPILGTYRSMATVVDSVSEVAHKLTPIREYPLQHSCSYLERTKKRAEAMRENTRSILVDEGHRDITNHESRSKRELDTVSQLSSLRAGSVRSSATSQLTRRSVRLKDPTTTF